MDAHAPALCLDFNSLPLFFKRRNFPQRLPSGLRYGDWPTAKEHSHEESFQSEHSTS
jgi:hypothetical protein